MNDGGSAPPSFTSNPGWGRISCMAGAGDELLCDWCGERFVRKSNRGPIPKSCSPSHRRKARQAEERSEEGPSERRANDPAQLSDTGPVVDISWMEDLIPRIDPSWLTNIAPMVDISWMEDLIPKIDPSWLTDIAPMVDTSWTEDLFPKIDTSWLTTPGAIGDIFSIAELAPKIDPSWLADVGPLIDTSSTKGLFPKIDTSWIAEFAPKIDTSWIAEFSPKIDSRLFTLAAAGAARATETELDFVEGPTEEQATLAYQLIIAAVVLSLLVLIIDVAAQGQLHPAGGPFIRYAGRNWEPLPLAVVVHYVLKTIDGDK